MTYLEEQYVRKRNAIMKWDLYRKAMNDLYREGAVTKKEFVENIEKLLESLKDI